MRDSSTPRPSVHKGARHDMLKRVAVNLRRRGLDHEELLAALRRANHERCHPPLPDREVLALVRWVVERVAPNRHHPPQPDPQAASDPLRWLAEYVGVPRSFLEQLPLRTEGDQVLFHFEEGLPVKLRKAGTKTFMWRPAGATVPPLWPLPGPELPKVVWLAEGETDALVARFLGLEAFGLTRGAGAALDLAQAEALRARGVQRVVLALDADQAGQEGTEKLARVLQAAGLEVLTVDWTAAGLDPLQGCKDLRDLWLASRDPARVRGALEGAVRPFVSLRDKAFSVHETKNREVRASDLQAEARATPPLRYLPFLGQDGFIARGLSHLVSGYAKAGKSTLLARLVAEWQAERVLVITEEPRQVWAERLRRMDTDLAHVALYFGLGVTRQELLGRIKGGSESLVVLDTTKLLGIEDDCSASQVTEALMPLLAACRDRGATFVALHHQRKGGGSHGEGIAGSHAFLALFDVALEVLRDEHHPHRRVVRGYSRVAEVPELVYELREGHLEALGEPAQLALQEVKERVAGVLGGDWATFKDISALLTDPRPSDRQVREALAALVGEGVAEMEPRAGRRPARWRLADVSFRARTNPSPETKRNQKQPDPAPRPRSGPESQGQPDLARLPGPPPGPGPGEDLHGLADRLLGPRVDPGEEPANLRPAAVYGGPEESRPDGPAGGRSELENWD